MEKEETVTLFHNGREMGLRLEKLLRKAGVNFSVGYRENTPELHEGRNIHVGAKAIRQFANRLHHQAVSGQPLENESLQVMVYLDDSLESKSLRTELDEKGIPHTNTPANGDHIPCISYRGKDYWGRGPGFSLKRFFADYETNQSE
jgi:hypothetical protein